MNILDIIAKKRDGKKLSKEEIDFFVQGYTNNSISDYQAAALIMAIYIKGKKATQPRPLLAAAKDKRRPSAQSFAAFPAVDNNQLTPAEPCRADH